MSPVRSDPFMSQLSRASEAIEIRLCQGRELAEIQPNLEKYLRSRGQVPLSLEPGMLSVLERGLRQVPYVLLAMDGDRVLGFVALAYVKSLVFGRFLVSLPYVNSAGVV